MKKILLKLIFCNIITLFFLGCSNWINCSLYDDLINTIETQMNLLRQKAQRQSNWHFTTEQVEQVLLTSKYADEYRSLIAEYNSAIQAKADCLNNETSSSNNNYYENNNTYNKSQNQICKEEFWNNSVAVWDECTCKDWYWWDSPDMNYCVKMDQSCKARFWNNSIAIWDECFCKDWYWWDSPDMNYCVKMDQSCKTRYWDNSMAIWDECFCKDWFERNSEATKCIKIIDSSSYNTFSNYENIAYNFAFNNKITTMPTVEKADLYWSLDRIAMAKMISNYAINVLWLTPNTNLNCSFKDVPNKSNEDYDYWVTKSCQLWLMWQWITKFRPWDKVTRAEFATVLSRLLNRESNNLDVMNSAIPYYTAHLEYLETNWIIDNVVSLWTSNDEIRWYVMLMLMRSQIAKNKTVQDYYNSLWNDILSCANTFENMNKNLDNDSLKEAKETCDKSLNDIINIGSWNWDATFFNAVIEDNLYISQLLNTLYQYTQNPTNKLKKEFDDMVYYMVSIANKLDKIEQNFADKYGINIE